MAAINYAKEYLQTLANEFPYVLYFGRLYETPNNGRYKMGANGRSVEIPQIKTTGRVDANRDTIGSFARNHDNNWILKTLSNQRKWDTLVHPKDIDQTDQTVTITNITKTFNETQKFPEMDAYTCSKIYADYIDPTVGNSVANLIDLVPSTDNVLSIFDTMMLNMNNGKVPFPGRVLYCTFEVEAILKGAKELTRNINVQTDSSAIYRAVSNLDNVDIVGVPSDLMKTAYDFTQGWKPAAGAEQIHMMLIHPMAVVTPVSYEFAQLNEPAATTQGKWVYYEESFEDVFILNPYVKGVQICVKKPTI